MGVCETTSADPRPSPRHSLRRPLPASRSFLRWRASTLTPPAVRRVGRLRRRSEIGLDTARPHRCAPPSGTNCRSLSYGTFDPNVSRFAVPSPCSGNPSAAGQSQADHDGRPARFGDACGGRARRRRRAPPRRTRLPGAAGRAGPSQRQATATVEPGWSGRAPLERPYGSRGTNRHPVVSTRRLTRTRLRSLGEPGRSTEGRGSFVTSPQAVRTRVDRKRARSRLGRGRSACARPPTG